MITRYGICPECGAHIPEHRHEDEWVLCECGWMGSNNTDKFESETQKKAISWILGTSFVLMLVFVHAARWGSDSITAIPLQTQVLLGIATPETQKTYADLSLQKHLHADAEFYYTKWAESVNTFEAWKTVALLRTRMKDYENAIMAFDKYYKAKGDDPLTLYHYAQVLEKVERPDLAETVYLHIVGLNKDNYQRTVVEELIQLFVSQQRLEDAKAILNQLSKPDMELPSHLVRQKEWIDQLIKDKSETMTSASL